MARRTRRRTSSRTRALGRHPSGLPLRTAAGKANFAYPQGVGPARGQHPSYPIAPRFVRAALSRSAQSRTAGTSSHVRAAIARRYGSVDAGLAAARRAAR